MYFKDKIKIYENYFLFKNAGTMICTQFNAALSRSSALTHTHIRNETNVLIAHTHLHTIVLFLLHSHTHTHTYKYVCTAFIIFSYHS